MFLDEIGDVDQAVQPKLLKVLEEGRFRRLGDVRDREVDVRLIAATHQDLAQAVLEKKFRSDLYFRISALPLSIPPLRERPEDIVVLAQSLLARIGQDVGRGELSLTQEAIASLQGYHWPGNTRELRNVLERAAILSRSDSLEPRDLRFSPSSVEGGSPSAEDSRLTLEEVERRHIERVLLEEGGHVERAARRLGVPRSSLYERIKRLGITTKKD
jgi:transcriptional regulator with GAF, ATPase, and Fis domain